MLSQNQKANLEKGIGVFLVCSSFCFGFFQLGRKIERDQTPKINPATTFQFDQFGVLPNLAVILDQRMHEFAIEAACPLGMQPYVPDEFRYPDAANAGLHSRCGHDSRQFGSTVEYGTWQKQLVENRSFGVK